MNNGVRDIKVQGEWELQVANLLNRKGVKWDRVKLEFDGIRWYTPDFYLTDMGIYLEVKGFMRERDKDKLWRVLDANKIDLRVILDPFSLTDDTDFMALPKFVEMYPRESIDKTKFGPDYNPVRRERKAREVLAKRERKERERRFCVCGKEIGSKAKTCSDCYKKSEKDKSKCPDDIQQLIREVEETSYCAVGRKYGVTDNAIRKWIKRSLRG